MPNLLLKQALKLSGHTACYNKILLLYLWN